MLSIGFKNTTELSAYFRRPNFFSLPDLAGALKSSSPLGPAHAGARLSSSERYCWTMALHNAPRGSARYHSKKSSSAFE